MAAGFTFVLTSLSRYGEGDEGFYSYLYQMNAQFNRTIWVTEYADTSLNDTGMFFLSFPFCTLSDLSCRGIVVYE